VLIEEAPAENTISPPEPLVPVPTVTYTEPDRPEVPVPVPIYKAPLFPIVDIPELNTSLPDIPDRPAFAVLIKRSALEVATPNPLTIDK